MNLNIKALTTHHLFISITLYSKELFEVRGLHADEADKFWIIIYLFFSFMGCLRQLHNIYNLERL